jgi:hypothetical protein
MANENQISLQISAEDKTSISEALNSLTELLNPHLMALSLQKRKTLTKMGDSSLPFVKKAMDYATSNPELVPAYLNVDEFRVDVEAVELLTDYIRIIDGLKSDIADSLSLSASEAMSAALLFYKSVKAAAKANVPGSKPIDEDLAKRFKHSKKNEEAPSEESGSNNDPQ